MNFKATFCDPFKPDIIELGDLEADRMIDVFEKTPWTDYLQKMETAKQGEIYYSPSLEIVNKDSKNGLAISAVGEPSNYAFYVFYKRPKKVKTFFGLGEKIDENYVTDITGQTKENVIDLLNALKRDDTAYLANKIGP